MAPIKPTRDIFGELNEPPQPELPEALREAYTALNYLACPYYRGVGICGTGCTSEPTCQTCEPDDGWAAELRRIVADV